MEPLSLCPDCLLAIHSTGSCQIPDPHGDVLHPTTKQSNASTTMTSSGEGVHRTPLCNGMPSSKTSMSGHSLSKKKNIFFLLSVWSPWKKKKNYCTHLVTSCLGPPTNNTLNSDRITEFPTPQLAKKYASNSTPPSAPEGMTASSPCVGTSTCTARVHTLARGAPINPELQWAWHS